MGRTLLFTLSLSLLAPYVFGQVARDFMVGGGFDLVKTDNEGFVQKAQIGFEGNYFLTRQFTASAGLEFWVNDGVSFAFGGRWYPIENFFTRIRGLVGENDVSIGAGWNKPITATWHFEAIGDFYFKGEFGIRMGLMYIIRR
ncbi:MAG: hypothetical protein OEV74_09695 [Cyclobacteriaceae bacterium]|jgi:hypothetical protein|nr:hypothetical protein [Cyclobacteriaceae bacterium]MDH4296542.1 hypothetical protein [Cyclobacteriaceae bacterium]MDH5250166.1 hypothetical protein [Cyclobacteriaceae bacterium]